MRESYYRNDESYSRVVCNVYAAYADVMILAQNQINSFAVFFVIYMVGVNGAQH